MNRLEKMDDFFAARVDGYDDHMKTNIDGATEFYTYTASLLPKAAGSTVKSRMKCCHIWMCWLTDRLWKRKRISGCGSGVPPISGC